MVGKNSPFSFSRALLGLALIGATVVFCAWQYRNQAYPDVDAAHIFSMSQEIKKVYQEKGAAEALSFAYFHKHWRPVILPLVGAAVLPMTDGVRPMLKTLSCVLFFLTLVLLVGFFMKSGESSIQSVATFLILFSSIFMGSATNLATEMFFITGFLAQFYLWLFDEGHLRTSRRANFYFALWAWTTLCRPVESFAIGLPFFLYTTWLWLKENRTTISEVLWSFSLASYVLVVLAAPTLLGKRGWSNSELIVISLLFGALAGFRLYLHPGAYLRGVLLYLTPILLWYLGGTWSLASWFQQTTYSVYARNTGGSLGRAYYEFWERIPSKIGWGILLFIALGFIAVLFGRSRRLPRRFLLMVFGFLSLNILATSLTYNWDLRYTYPNYLGLVVLSGIAVSDIYERAQRRLKIALLTMSLTLSGFVCVDWLQTNEMRFIGRNDRFLKPRDSEVLFALAQDLRRLIADSDPVVGLIWNESDSTREINGWTLQMWLLDQGYEWTVRSLPYLNSVDLNSPYAQPFTQNKFLVIGPLEFDGKKFVDGDQAMAWFKDHCNSQRCDKDYLRYVSSFTIDGGPEYGPLTYDLLESRSYIAKGYPERFD